MFPLREPSSRSNKGVRPRHLQDDFPGEFEQLESSEGSEASEERETTSRVPSKREQIRRKKAEKGLREFTAQDRAKLTEWWDRERTTDDSFKLDKTDIVYLRQLLGRSASELSRRQLSAFFINLERARHPKGWSV